MAEVEHRQQDDGTTVAVPRNDAGRVVRGCDVCRQVDDQPRHVLGVPPDWPGAVPAGSVIGAMVKAAGAAGLTDEQTDYLIAEHLDPLTVVRHPDCCAATGCYDGTCRALLARHDGKTRGPLVAALEAETADMTREG